MLVEHFNILAQKAADFATITKAQNDKLDSSLQQKGDDTEENEIDEPAGSPHSQ